MTDYDALIVGGGHNGLVCAAYLGRAGHKVAVLEANDAPGGAASTREFAAGFSTPGCAQWVQQFSPQIIGDLALEQHGLQWAGRDLASIALDASGHHLQLQARNLEGEGLPASDREAYREFNRKTLKYARLLGRALEDRPPSLVDAGLADRFNLLKLGLGLKLMGKRDMSDFLRILLINMYDLMHEHFEDPRLQSLLCMDAVLGAHMGPRSPNTVFGYLYRRLGDSFGNSGPGQLRGGPGTLGRALAASAAAHGVDIRLGTPVQQIDVEAGRAVGVTLDGGEALRASRVISSADPVTTFRELVGFRNLEAGTVRRVSHVRYKSGAGKLHLALKGPPRFSGLDVALLGQRLLIAPDMDYMERAFNAIKYDEVSAAPIFDISIPTINDDSLAPPGQHVLSAIVQYLPYAPEGGWEVHRGPVIERLLDSIEVYAPGIRDQLVAAELLTPADLEREYRMSGGHWHHAELSLDQVLIMRPFPGCSQYATPLRGLYLCGAGAHPGGDLMGLAGRNAAREILKRGEGL